MGFVQVENLSLFLAPDVVVAHDVIHISLHSLSIVRLHVSFGFP